MAMALSYCRRQNISLDFVFRTQYNEMWVNLIYGMPSRYQRESIFGAGEKRERGAAVVTASDVCRECGQCGQSQ